MINNILLSICIPTYNRAEILEKSLNVIKNDKYFDTDIIEVVVLDNCSSDNTTEIVKKFNFVSYFRNNTTIPAGINVIKALEYGNGKYLKLYNDTVILKNGTIDFILKKINSNDYSNNLLFYNNNHLYSNCEVNVNDKKSLIQTVSFSSTWILNFGILKTEFEKINNKYEFSDLQLPQVDILFKLLNNNNNFIIYFSDFVEVHNVEKKGGYNIFDVFINNYLFILKSKKLTYVNYEIEKFRLFRFFIYPWLIRLFIVEKSLYSFETNKSFSILFKKYFFHIYIYPFLSLFFLKIIFHTLHIKVQKLIN